MEGLMNEKNNLEKKINGKEGKSDIIHLGRTRSQAGTKVAE